MTPKQYNQYVTGQRKCFKVFVYGTLIPGFWNFDRLQLANFKPLQTPATIKGRLFWAHEPGSFPAFVNQPSYQVKGVILTFSPASMPEVLGRLDSLEGFTVERTSNHYDRILKTAVDASGRFHRVFTYTYTRSDFPTYASDREIKTGDFPSAYQAWKTQQSA